MRSGLSYGAARLGEGVGALRLEFTSEPAEVLTLLNRTLYGLISGFATCCVALVTQGGELTVANAGHLSPYRNGAELAVDGGLPLGVVEEMNSSSQSFQLQRGDKLTFVSDGVVEAMSRNGELFGFERTAAISTGTALLVAETAQRFSAGQAQADDITVLTLEYLA